jgi:hypothetical protein
MRRTKLGRKCKEEVVPTLNYYPNIFLQVLRKTNKELGTKVVPAEVQTKSLRNTSQLRHR